jgi:hypothetical protein
MILLFVAICSENITVFWDIMPCSSDEVRRFGEIYHLHIRNRRVSQQRQQEKAEGKIDPEDGGYMFH